MLYPQHAAVGFKVCPHTAVRFDFAAYCHVVPTVLPSYCLPYCCVLQALVPPTANEMVQGWLEDTGNMPKSPPKSQWAPTRQPLPDSLEARGPAAASAPAAKSSGSSSRLGLWAKLTCALAAAAVVAAAV